MRHSIFVRLGVVGTLLAAFDSPAFAGIVPVTPAPVLGAGAGALALLGLGYYGLAKRRRR